MSAGLPIEIRHRPVLDPGFLPAILWNKAYEARAAATSGSAPLVIALDRPDGTCFVHRTQVLPHRGENVALNRKYVERLVKFLLWQKGGNHLTIGGEDHICSILAEIYSENGERAFDRETMGRKMFRSPISVEVRAVEDMPGPKEATVTLGRHLDGCRIGFDLGGSDRKCAAVVDGEVVFSEEVAWDPYFQADPQYHFDGIDDTIRRAAEKLPRVDSIGGSSAGAYANNEVLVASLFRGISDGDFETHVRRIFWRLKEKWGGVPFEVTNDGEVTALAGSMSLNDNCVLGISMGTAEAAGYCNPAGHITCWLNELAFAPVDYGDGAPRDEWSGDIGCGVQYFSQQAVARLAPRAGIDLPEDMPFADRLEEVQALMRQDDRRARRVYETIGTYLGYTIPWYARFYEIRHLLLLGRVTSGLGGRVIIDRTRAILEDEYPDLAGAISITTPHSRIMGGAGSVSSDPQAFLLSLRWMYWEIIRQHKKDMSNEGDDDD